MTTLPRLVRTASFRLAAAYALVFAGSVLVLGGVVFWTTHTALQEQMAGRIEGEIATLRSTYERGGRAALVEAVRQRSQGPATLHHLVIDADGRILAGGLTVVPERTGWSDLDTGSSDADDDEQPSVRALTLLLGDGTRLVVGDDLDDLEDAEEAIVDAFSLAIAVMLVLGIAGGVVLSAAFLRRVDAIARTAEAISAGDLASRVPVGGTGDDFDRLAATLNRMLDRIADLMESLRQVSNDIAHDLRTPLARLRQRLERARATARTAGDYQDAVDAALTETDSIMETFAALLRIAQIEAGTRLAAGPPVDLAGIVETVVDAFAPSAEDEGKTLCRTLCASAVVFGDRELLTQLLANLVENAIRHTPPGTRIDVTLEAGRGCVRLTVADDGPGVPAAEHSRIFRRFYRLERSRTTDGSGLGLSLVMAIATRHGATVTVEDNRPGLRITLGFADARTS